jgi:hypothetical protein
MGYQGWLRRYDVERFDGDGSMVVLPSRLVRDNIYV